MNFIFLFLIFINFLKIESEFFFEKKILIDLIFNNFNIKNPIQNKRINLKIKSFFEYLKDKFNKKDIIKK